MDLLHHLIMSKTDIAVIEEKVNKLSGTAKILKNYLKEGFDSLLSLNEIKNLNRVEKISILNKRLKKITDLVAQSFPLVGVGYYSKELDAIITYGPSKKFGDKVGQSISSNHLGREVMAKDKEMVVTEEMVRGHCMAYFSPLKKKKEIIGYVWATEPIQEIYKQIREIKQKKTKYTDLKIIIDILPLISLFIEEFSILNVSKTNKLKDILFSQGKKNIEFKKDIDQLLFLINNLKEYVNNIFENINVALIIIDLKRYPIFFNKSAQWLFKKEKKETILGNDIYHSLPDFKILGLRRIVKEVIGTGKSYIASEINYPGEKKDKILNIGVSLLQNINKQKIGAVIIIEDITDERILEQKKTQEKKLSAFGKVATNLAHEIGNPLTAIKALTQLLPERINSRDFVDRYINEVAKETERIDKIIKNLFSLVRSPSSYFEYININPILNDCLFFVGGMAKIRQIKITKELKKDLPKILVDRNQIKQVFINLILNAFNAMPKGGKLEACTTYDCGNQYVKITFKDNGCGITNGSIDKIFKPFFTTNKNGTGIGLSVSYNIVKQYGGFIQVESREGRGSTFTVILPKEKII